MRVKNKRVGRRVTLAQALTPVFYRLKLRGYEYAPEISQVEQELADTLSLYSRAQWPQQVKAETDFAPFFLDMVYWPRPDRAIAIECDGYPYHQDAVRDFCRDALILGDYDLSCIYRIEAWAVRKQRIDWLRILSSLEPDLFAADRVQAIRAFGVECDSPAGRTFRDRTRPFITRLTPEMVSVRRLIEFARSSPRITFPDLVERVRRSDIVGRAA